MKKEQTKYDERHGGPYDRGSADAWYGRKRNPHYFNGGTGMMIYAITDLTDHQRDAYNAGFDEQVASGDFKYS